MKQDVAPWHSAGAEAYALELQIVVVEMKTIFDSRTWVETSFRSLYPTGKSLYFVSVEWSISQQIYR